MTTRPPLTHADAIRVIRRRREVVGTCTALAWLVLGVAFALVLLGAI